MKFPGRGLVKKLKESRPSCDDDPMVGIRCLAIMNIALKAGIPFQNAVVLSRRISKGTVRRVLDRALKETLLGRSSELERTVEEEFNGTLGRMNWISVAVHDDLIALSEPDIEIRGILLDRSFDTALDSCRSSVKESVSGLRVPISTIFALGIVLPIIIATILPLWGIISTDTLYAVRGENIALDIQEEKNLPISYLFSACSILFFPLICLFATQKLLRKRREVGEFNIRNIDLRLLITLLLINGWTIGFVLLLPSVPSWAFATVCLAIIFAQGRYHKQENLSKQENLLRNPAILSMISSRLISGDHFVRATALSLENHEEEKKVFWRTILPPDSHDEIMTQFEDETSRLISDSSEKDPRLAAKMLRQLAWHLNELSSIEKEIQMELKPINQSILVATIFLSPFVLGIVSGFGSIGLFINSGSQSFFEILFMAFIIEMALTGKWLIECISSEGQSISSVFKKSHYTVAISIAIFVLSSEISTFMFS